MPTASPILLRFARRSEVDRIAEVVNAAYEAEAPFVGRPRTSVEALRAQWRAGDFIVAESERGRIVGCVFVTEERPVGRFSLLAVAPEEQGHGIGRELVRAAEARLRRLACEEARILVLDRRTELIAWYHRLGYRECGRRPYPYPERMLVPCEFVEMRRQLSGEEP